ncbi:MAG: NTP transferase domain-containing protein [Candidatus Hydrothermae bacterium]|nr:NTP transferase domain-containing protein [Candidatus Hydrothermae bacterium]
MVRAVVIPAAGRGTRLAQKTRQVLPKALLPVGGRPLLHWTLEALRDLGVTRIWVVTGAHRAPFESLRHAYGVDLIHHARWERGNGDTLRVGLEAAFQEEEAVGVLMSDHLYAPMLLEDLVRGAHRGHLLWMDPHTEAVLDLEDAMKVRRRPPALSKTLPVYDGVDIGMFRLERDILPFFRKVQAQGRFGIADALEAAFQAGRLHLRPVPAPGLWLDVDTPAMLEAAEAWVRRF